MKLMLLRTIKTAQLHRRGRGRGSVGWFFSYHLTTHMWENQPWMHNCVCGKLQVGTTTSTGAVLVKVMTLVSRLTESEKLWISGP